MYTKNEFKKGIVVLMMVVVLFFGVEVAAKNYEKGPDVDTIYSSIRHTDEALEWVETIVTFQNEGMTLVCSLTIPETSKLCPIVITLNGFGGWRDEAQIPGTEEGILKRTARILAEQGFASLRVDFRGSGESDGDYTMTTFSTQISDALAAVDYIAKNLKHQVNTKSIGIIGFSQGGLVGAVTAAKDKRVDSLVLWSPVSHAPIVYEGLFTKAGLKRGLAMADGGSDSFGIYVNDQYVSWDVPLGKGFFEDLFNIDPVAACRNYKKPLMVISGRNDIIIWPQPAMSKLYLKYHKGKEKLVQLDADHAFNYWDGPTPEKLDDAIFWSTAWFKKTLKTKVCFDD